MFLSFLSKLVALLESKGGEIRDTKTLLLRVEEMQHADWLICLLELQDGVITTNLLRD